MMVRNGTAVRLACRTLLLTLLMIAAGSVSLHAQVPHDTRGTKFWLAFMENLGNSPVSDLRLYLAGQSPTTARIIFHLTNDTVVVPLPIPNRTVEIKIDSVYNSFIELREGDELSMKSVEVLADDDITLYGININSKSADAFLCLPDDVITGRYIVLGYPNGQTGTGDPSEPVTWDNPSEFAVVGTEDGTTVRITPPAGTIINGRFAPTFTIGLNKGEVFFAQAQLVGSQDISGSEVVANKPIAVFGGNARTSIPAEVGNFRDHLVEQMPPLEAWGKEAVLTPHYNITPTSRHRSEARVLAAFDNTVWRINGVQQPQPLMRGEPVRLDLITARVVTADGPILVGQYEHSVDEYLVPPSLNNPAGIPKLGDPFMTLIPPSEQFDTAYAFQSITHEEFDDTAHFVNVVIPTTGTGTLELDGVLVSTTNVFFLIPGSRFSYAQIRVKPGAHFIRAKEPFGLYAYGFGAANSYGYNGGMLFRTLVNDFQPPEILADSRCDTLDGFAFDTHITDTGIDSLYATGDTQNVELAIDPFVGPKDSVYFRARLIDPYRDGIVGLKAIDSSGRSFTRVLGIPGFTVRALGGNGTTPVLYDTLFSFNGGTFCRKYQVENTGRFPQVITGVNVLPDMPAGMTVSGTYPITIPPGERREIEFCFTGLTDSTMVRNVQIVGNCIERTIASVPMVGAIDTTLPKLIKTSERCFDDYVLTFKDESRFGFATASVDSLVNGEILPTDRPDEVRLRWRDRRYDMIYQVRISDRAGNSLVERDTLAGFTVAALNRFGDTISAARGLGWSGDSLDLGNARCDSLTLTNFGSRTISIDHGTLLGNIGLSIPQTQFPIVLEPGEQRKLEICLARPNTLVLDDTLLLTDACGVAELVPLNAPVRNVEVSGLDNCRNVLRVSFFGPAKRTFLTTPVPNPVQSAAVHVDVGLVQAGTVTLELRDASGELVLDVMRGTHLPEGISRIEFDVSSLESGPYFCTMTTGTGERVVEKLIVAH